MSHDLVPKACPATLKITWSGTSNPPLTLPALHHVRLPPISAAEPPSPLDVRTFLAKSPDPRPLHLVLAPSPAPLSANPASPTSPTSPTSPRSPGASGPRPRPPTPVWTTFYQPRTALHRDSAGTLVDMLVPFKGGASQHLQDAFRLGDDDDAPAFEDVPWAGGAGVGGGGAGGVGGGQRAGGEWQRMRGSMGGVVSLEARGRGTFALALCVHVVENGEDPEVAKGIVREAWVRTHRLNRLGSQAVPHWFGLYAGVGERAGVQVPVYAGLVAASGAEAQRDAIATAYKQIHDLGVVHRAANPRNWEFGHGVAIAEWGRAHIRRRGFGFAREVDSLGIEWVVDELEFDRLRAAEEKRVRSFFAEQAW